MFLYPIVYCWIFSLFIIIYCCWELLFDIHLYLFLIPWLYCIYVIQKIAIIDFLIHSNLFMKIKQLNIGYCLIECCFFLSFSASSLWMYSLRLTLMNRIFWHLSKGLMLCNTFKLTRLSNLVNEWDLCMCTPLLSLWLCRNYDFTTMNILLIKKSKLNEFIAYIF